jgi:hypothetical protein
MSSYRPNWGLPDAEPGQHPPGNAAQDADGAAQADPEDGFRGYSDVYAWVTQWALPTLGRSTLGDGRWCARWHDHPEAMLRLELAWKTWERARRDPAAYNRLAPGHLGPHVGRPHRRRRTLCGLYTTAARQAP